jgi:hypothetical protein
MHHTTIAAASIAIALVAASGPADAASNPCGSVELRRGKVVVGNPIVVGDALPPAAEGCLRHIGQILARLPTVRTVTIAIRLPDKARGAGVGKRLVATIEKLMTEVGIPASRISTVVPAARAGEPAAVHVSYRERRGARAVAMITSATGRLAKGRYRSAMASTGEGARLVAYEYLQTPDANSSARLVLADGSEMRVYPRSLLLVGPVVLNAKLKREVSVELLAGSIKIQALYGGAGSKFNVRTRTAVAGVRGTDFRLSLAGAYTRLETEGGAVQLTGSKSAVRVGAGYGSRGDATGTPEKPRALLAAPLGLRPVAGVAGAGAPLSWRAVPGAASYVIDIARDAYFTRGFRSVKSPGPSQAVPAQLVKAKWFWRVRAVDRDGFVGMPSKVYAFTVR